MHLLSPLAAGVAGCESGTAEIFQRGTSTRATYYLGNDGFEGGGSVSSGADVTLDANGGAQVYVNEYVDVVCKDSDGVEVRRFTAGFAATAIEVDSDSFTGTPYDGGASAVSEPITLAAILDKWNDSAGAADWKVLVGGVATDLEDAVTTGFGSVVFNVKASAYGAVGDGVTDDRTAIAAAITAAAAVDGIVFFPSGTYRIESGITVPYNVWMVGCGPNASVIAPSHVTAHAITFTGDASAIRHTLMFGLALQPSAATTGSLLVSLATNTLYLKIVGCEIGNANADGACFSSTNSSLSLEMHDCRVVQGGTATALVCGTVPAKLRGCTMVLASTGAFVTGSNLDIEGCTFDNSAVSGAGTTLATAAANIGLTDNVAVTARIVNCTFTSPNTNSVIAIATGASNAVAAASVIHESGNVFESSVLPYRVRWGAASKGARLWLGSRLGRRYEVTNNDATFTVDDEVMFYETIVVKRSTSTDQTVQFENSTSNYTQLPDGNYTTVMVWNEAGGNITAETFSFNGAGAAVGISDNNSAMVHLKHLHVESVCGPYATAPVVATGDPY